MSQAASGGRRKVAYAIVAAGIASIVGLIYVVRSDQSSAAAPPAAAESAVPAPDTIGAQWQWQQFARAERAEPARQIQPAANAPFTVAGVYSSLRQVRLDESGSVVLDSEALSALREAFESMPAELTLAQLEQLQQIIRTGLPGHAGEQVAKVVADYHSYRQAQQRLEARQADASQDPAAALARLDEVVALRQQQFGAETAEQLFGKEQAFTRYTLESMRIQTATNLSEGQKAALQSGLKAQLESGVLPEKPDAAQRDFQRRYEVFQIERQVILDAGLTTADQREQIERLLSVHFRPQEIERARSYVPESP